MYTPVIEFTALETKQTWTFGVPSFPDYPSLQKVGAETTVAYPPNDPTQVIVFDRKYLIKDFVKWTFVSILLILISWGLYSLKI